MFLPFTKALSFDFGFPMKISEILFSLSLLHAPFFLKFSVTKNVSYFSQYYFAFLIFAFISFLLVFIGFRDFDFFISQKIDAIKKILQIFFGFAIFYLIYFSFKYLNKSIFYAWMTGTVISLVYLLYTQICFALFGSAKLLPGLERHQQYSVAGFETLRSGTFHEGNTAGLYFLLSLILATHFRNKIFIVISAAAIVCTFSISAFAGLVVFAGLYKLTIKKNRSRNLLYLLGTLILSLALSTEILKDRFSRDPGSSYNVRLNETLTGLDMFGQNALLGVGLAQYSYRFNEYEWNWRYSLFVNSAKRIPNNVFIELGTEGGIFLLSAFICLWLAWVYYQPAQGRRLAIAAMISIFTVFLAYPSYNLIFIWCFAAVIFAKNDDSGPKSEPIRRRFFDLR